MTGANPQINLLEYIIVVMIALRHQSTNKPGNISVTVGEKLNSHKIINQPINQS
jgi:hypothetical protein